MKPLLILSNLHQVSISNSTKFYQMMVNGIVDIYEACNTIPKPYLVWANSLEPVGPIMQCVCVENCMYHSISLWCIWMYCWLCSAYQTS